MKTFKDTTILNSDTYCIAENHSGLFVVVKDDKVELRRMNGGAIQRFATGAVFAILSGNIIQVNLKSGKTVFYKLSSSGNSVSGPYLR